MSQEIFSGFMRLCFHFVQLNEEHGQTHFHFNFKENVSFVNYLNELLLEMSKETLTNTVMEFFDRSVNN